MDKIDYFSIQRVFDYLPMLLSKLHITLMIALFSLLLGFLLGLFIAAIRLYKTPILYQIVTIYISFIRGVPINIQLFIVYFGLPALLYPLFLPFGVNINNLGAIYFVIATYAFSSSVYFAIIISAAVNGVDKGQMEAARSIGMTRKQAFLRIVSPQAFHIAIPEFGNVAVSILKNTSLAFTVGVIDMVGMISAIAARTRHSLEGYVGAGIIYLVLCALLEKAFSYAEKKYKIYK